MGEITPSKDDLVENQKQAMSKVPGKELKHLAMVWFVYAQMNTTEIAKQLNVSRQSISAWKRDNCWDEVKERVLHGATQMDILTYESLISGLQRKAQKEGGALAKEDLDSLKVYHMIVKDLRKSHTFENDVIALDKLKRIYDVLEPQFVSLMEDWNDSTRKVFGSFMAEAVNRIALEYNQSKLSEQDGTTT